MQILITGSEGLIGRPLRSSLMQDGHIIHGYDIQAKNTNERGDIKDFSHLDRLIPLVDGIIHLAGVSRVIDGERDPTACRLTNVGGTKNIIKSAQNSPNSPWILFSSSREVYGEPYTLPVPDTATLNPVNIYGECKALCEELLLDARQAGLTTGIVRLSNVYGSTQDHYDRVIPAFCRAAAEGGQIRIEGSQNTFDFTHVDDTVRGIIAFVDKLEQHKKLPPIHLVTGRGTTLERLSQLATKYGSDNCTIVERPPRTFDVSKFCGAPIFAKKHLNWSASIQIEEGVQRLIYDFKAITEEVPA